MGYMHPEIAMQEFDSLCLFVDDDIKLQCQKPGQPSGLKVGEMSLLLKNLLAELPGVNMKKRVNITGPGKMLQVLYKYESLIRKPRNHIKSKVHANTCLRP